MTQRKSILSASRVLAFTCCVAGLALIPASRFIDLDPVVNLAPAAAILFLALLAFTLTSKRDRVVISMMILAFIGPASLIAPEVFGVVFSERVREVNKPSLKVLVLNVWANNKDHRAVLRLISEEQPDIVFVQEAYSPWRQLLQGLESSAFIASCIDPAQCNAAILTKLKATGEESPYTSSLATARLFLPDRLGGGEFEAASIHLSRPPPMKNQIKEIEKLEQAATDFGDLAIIAGDFNSTPWTSAMRRLDRSLSKRRVTRLLPTWPAAMPIAPIDHIYVGKGWAIVDLRLGPNVGSDHRPIIAVLVLRQHDIDVRSEEK